MLCYLSFLVIIIAESTFLSEYFNYYTSQSINTDSNYYEDINQFQTNPNIFSKDLSLALLARNSSETYSNAFEYLITINSHDSKITYNKRQLNNDTTANQKYSNTATLLSNALNTESGWACNVTYLVYIDSYKVFTPHIIQSIITLINRHEEDDFMLFYGILSLFKSYTFTYQLFEICFICVY